MVVENQREVRVDTENNLRNYRDGVRRDLLRGVVGNLREAQEGRDNLREVREVREVRDNLREAVQGDTWEVCLVRSYQSFQEVVAELTESADMRQARLEEEARSWAAHRMDLLRQFREAEMSEFVDILR